MPEPREPMTDTKERFLALRFCPGLSHAGSGEPLGGDEEVGGGDEGDVAVPAGPGAAFEVVQAEAGLELAEVVFDAPAALG
jgi:hypothetical protein